MLSTAILGAAQQTNRSAAAAEQPTAPPQPRPILNSASAAGFEAVVKPFLAGIVSPATATKSTYMI
jgi:hypothetical protein